MKAYSILFFILVIIIKILDIVAKERRISRFKELDNSKIESIGKYEKNAKSILSFLNIWKNGES